MMLIEQVLGDNSAETGVENSFMNDPVISWRMITNIFLIVQKSRYESGYYTD